MEFSWIHRLLYLQVIKDFTEIVLWNESKEISTCSNWLTAEGPGLGQVFYRFSFESRYKCLQSHAVDVQIFNTERW